MLRSMKSGYINGKCVNHISYADNTVLISPHPGSIQELINVCYDFAVKNVMLYNVSKCCCLAFVPCMYGNLHLSKVVLGNDVLNWVSLKKYLGILIGSDSSNDLDIEQVVSIYSRCNMLKRNFKHCRKDVKMELFRTYYIILSLSHLWCKFRKASHSRIKLAYNNIFCSFQGVNRSDSVSNLYVENNMHCLEHQLIFGFYKCIMNSTNRFIYIFHI